MDRFRSSLSSKNCPNSTHHRLESSYPATKIPLHRGRACSKKCSRDYLPSGRREAASSWGLGGGVSGIQQALHRRIRFSGTMPVPLELRSKLLFPSRNNHRLQTTASTAIASSDHFPLPNTAALFFQVSSIFSLENNNVAEIAIPDLESKKTTLKSSWYAM